MTAREARALVCEVRRAADRLMRALSVPNPEWERAAMEAMDVQETAQTLVSELSGEMWKSKWAEWLSPKGRGDVTRHGD